MKQLTYVEALANLLKFVSKIGQDPKQSEATQQEAAEVAADFLIAALLQSRKAPEETPAETGTKIHTAMEDNYGRSTGNRCTRCHGRGWLHTDNKNETDTCHVCHGSGKA